MPFAAAVSTHPVSAHATGEILGQILEGVGPFPDLVLLFATRGHAGALEDVVAAVHAVLSPSLLVGAVAGGPAPALVSWAGVIGPVAPLRVVGPGLRAGWPGAFEPQGAVVFADAGGFPLDEWLELLAAEHPGLPVVGTLPAGGPLLLGRERHWDGAVGAVIGPGAQFGTRTSVVARPIGDSLLVTRSRDDIVYELDGIAAWRRLQDLARDRLPAADLHLVNESLHLGSAPSGSPFPLRRVLGVDRASGALAIETRAPDGPVQFFVRDPAWAQRALGEVLAATATEATLLFADEHAGANAPRPPAGCAGDGVVGPAGGANGRHRLAVSIAGFVE